MAVYTFISTAKTWRSNNNIMMSKRLRTSFWRNDNVINTPCVHSDHYYFYDLSAHVRCQAFFKIQSGTVITRFNIQWCWTHKMTAADFELTEDAPYLVPWASYVVYIVRFSEKMDRVINESHCMYLCSDDRPIITLSVHPCSIFHWSSATIPVSLSLTSQSFFAIPSSFAFSEHSVIRQSAK